MSTEQRENTPFCSGTSVPAADNVPASLRAVAGINLTDGEESAAPVRRMRGGDELDVAGLRQALKKTGERASMQAAVVTRLRGALEEVQRICDNQGVRPHHRVAAIENVVEAALAGDAQESRLLPSSSFGLQDLLDVIQAQEDAYPTSIWPEGGDSLSCKSAFMARRTCQNIRRALLERAGDIAADTIAVPRDLLEALYENSTELAGEWAWRRGAAKERWLTDVEAAAGQARALLDGKAPAG